MTLSPPILQAQQNDVAVCFPLLFGLQKHTEFLKTDSERLIPYGSGHIFNFCLAPSWAEKTRLECSDTDLRGLASYHSKTSQIRVATFYSRWVFMAQGGPRKWRHRSERFCRGRNRFLPQICMLLVNTLCRKLLWYKAGWNVFFRSRAREMHYFADFLVFKATGLWTSTAS